MRYLLKELSGGAVKQLEKQQEGRHFLSVYCGEESFLRDVRTFYMGNTIFLLDEMIIGKFISTNEHFTIIPKSEKKIQQREE